MTSATWAKVQLRRKPDLKALIAVANGSNLLNDFDLAQIVVDNEIGNVLPSLSALAPATLGHDTPLTLDSLTQALNKGVDIVYLVCHGSLTDGKPTLYFQKDNGKVAVVDGGEFATRISQLEYPPRLIVLASCESAGREDIAFAAQSSFATRLAEAGVPAVLAMQGKVSVNSIKTMMPIFFAQLMKDGQIDRALAVARRAIANNSDAWMPALFLRLKRGCLWYVPGFAGAAGKSAFQQWSSICTYVNQGKIIPIVGPDLGEHIWGSAQDQALAIADTSNFPLSPDEKVDLAKVTQYIATTNSPAYARDQLGKVRFNHFKERNKAIFAASSPAANPGALLDMVVAARRQDPTDPYTILADLDARIYISASPDSLLDRFLKAKGKTPNAKYCQWRDNSKSHPVAPVFEGEPTAAAPYLYYAFGSLANPDSQVITEDDFFDYLISTSRFDLMPTIVSGSMMENSLLFLGFSLSDWKFRVFFRLLMAFGGRVNMENFNHVGVQIDPEDNTLDDVEMAREYLSRYFRRANIDIYWGSSSEFLTELVAQRKAMPIGKDEGAPRPVDLSAFG